MNLDGKKRSQGTRHCGFVVSDLSTIGAGTSEGWLQDPALLVAMSSQRRLLAFAKTTHALIVTWEGPEDDGDTPPPVYLRLPESSPKPKNSQEQQPEQQPQQTVLVTALQWLAFRDVPVLSVGTSSGSVLFYSTEGVLIYGHVFQNSPVLQLRVRGSNRKSSQQNSVEELCLVYAKTIVRIDSLDLQPLLFRCLKEVGDREWKSKTMIDFNSHKLPHQIWNASRNIGGSSICVDGVISGVMAPPLFEHQSTRRYFCAITVGPDCTLAAHRLSEDRSSSITNLIMNKIMPVTVSTVSALAKMIWRSNDQQPSDYRPPEVKPQDFGRASLITSLKDRPRKGERISLSPSGAMAAITDSLGRILLVDTQALVVIRLWKGYRDAFCFFIELPADSGVTSTSSKPSNQPKTKQDLILCLAIHAPRRGVVEIWKLRDGPRIAIIKCENGCRVIQPTPQFRGSEYSSEDLAYTPAEAYILNGDSGQLSLISPHIRH